MYQEVSKLEQLIDSNPHSLGPHIVKVVIYNVNITITYCMIGIFLIVAFTKILKVTRDFQKIYFEMTCL